MNIHLFGKKLLIQFTVRVFCERISTRTCVSFPVGFEGGLLDLIVLVGDHCLSFYFAKPNNLEMWPNNVSCRFLIRVRLFKTNDVVS